MATVVHIPPPDYGPILSAIRGELGEKREERRFRTQLGQRQSELEAARREREREAELEDTRWWIEEERRRGVSEQQRLMTEENIKSSVLGRRATQETLSQSKLNWFLNRPYIASAIADPSQEEIANLIISLDTTPGGLRDIAMSAGLQKPDPSSPTKYSWNWGALRTRKALEEIGGMPWEVSREPGGAFGARPLISQEREKFYGFTREGKGVFLSTDVLTGKVKMISKPVTPETAEGLRMQQEQQEMEDAIAFVSKTLGVDTNQLFAAIMLEGPAKQEALSAMATRGVNIAEVFKRVEEFMRERGKLRERVQGKYKEKEQEKGEGGEEGKVKVETAEDKAASEREAVRKIIEAVADTLGGVSK